jgi:tRNA(Ile)-lysidine synthase
VSGGRDSMLMLWLFHNAGFQIDVAHCNFTLRGSESDADENLVRDYCATRSIPLHVNRFETTAFAQENKLSIQMAARELRYTWFDKLATDLDCDAIAIAQHKNDHIETVLLNLTRGTGLTGLQGILPKRGKIIRPLLFLNAKEVIDAVTELCIPYRDDASNFSTKYARNKIRLDIIPQFEELSPDFIPIMEDNIARFQDAHQVLQILVEDLRQKLFLAKGNDSWHIEKSVLWDYDLALLYYLFEPFGFTKPILQDLKNLRNGEPGKIFESPTHHLLLDREEILLQKKQHNTQPIAIIREDCCEITWRDQIFQINVSNDMTISKNPLIAKLDHDKLSYPLQIRSWQESDFFQPLGMKGKKKLSDFFIQKKINRFEKKNIAVCCSGNGDIIWICGLQIDDRYKITENTQKVLTLVCQKKGI